MTLLTTSNFFHLILGDWRHTGKHYDAEGVNDGKFQEVFKFRASLYPSRAGSATSAVIHHGLSIERLILIPLIPALSEVNIITALQATWTGLSSSEPLQWKELTSFQKIETSMNLHNSHKIMVECNKVAISRNFVNSASLLRSIVIELRSIYRSIQSLCLVGRVLRCWAAATQEVVELY